MPVSKDEMDKMLEDFIKKDQQTQKKPVKDKKPNTVKRPAVSKASTPKTTSKNVFTYDDPQKGHSTSNMNYGGSGQGESNVKLEKDQFIHSSKEAVRGASRGIGSFFDSLRSIRWKWILWGIVILGVILNFSTIIEGLMILAIALILLNAFLS